MLVPKHILLWKRPMLLSNAEPVQIRLQLSFPEKLSSIFLVCTCAVLKLNLNMQVLLKFTIRGAKNEYREFEIRNIWAALAARDLW